MRAAALLVIAGCWSSPPAVDERPLAERAQPAPAPRVHTMVWEGHYVCAQGPTALRLTIESTGSALEATFDFGALPENPSVPHGSYRMTGTVSRAGGGEVSIVLAPVAWIEQPPMYFMVGFHATSSHDRRFLRGQIDDASCGELELRRVEG